MLFELVVPINNSITNRSRTISDNAHGVSHTEGNYKSGKNKHF